MLILKYFDNLPLHVQGLFQKEKLLPFLKQDEYKKKGLAAKM